MQKIEQFMDVIYGWMVPCPSSLSFLLRSSFHCFCIRSTFVGLLRFFCVADMHLFHGLHTPILCSTAYNGGQGVIHDSWLPRPLEALCVRPPISNLVCFQATPSFFFLLSLLVFLHFHPSILGGRGSTGNKRAAVTPSRVRPVLGDQP